MPWSTAIRTVLLTVVWAIAHSLLASLPAKRRARDVAGERVTDGLYRFGYNGISVLSFIAYLAYLWRLPDRRLYRMKGWKGRAMQGGQLLSVAALLYTNWQNGLGRVTGIRHLYDLLTGREISPPVVAQHPLPDGKCMTGWRGTYRISSHPNNYFVLALWWLSPVMTLKWASVGAVTAVYMVLGSMHEDHRLLHAYGPDYDCYRERVAHWFMFPVDRWRRNRRRVAKESPPAG